MVLQHRNFYNEIVMILPQTHCIMYV